MDVKFRYRDGRTSASCLLKSHYLNGYETTAAKVVPRTLGSLTYIEEYGMFVRDSLNRLTKRVPEPTIPGLKPCHGVRITKIESQSTSGALTSILGLTWPSQVVTGQLAAMLPVAEISLDYPVTNYAMPSWMIDGANIKTFAKLSSPEVGGGETIAEIHQTFQLLRNPISGLVKAMQGLDKAARKNVRIINKSSKFDYVRAGGSGFSELDFSLRERLRSVSTARKASYLFDALSDQWLQYRYGFTPLVKDVSKIVEDSMYGVDLDINKVRRVGGGLKTLGPKTTGLSDSGNAIPGFTSSWRVTDEYNYSANGVIHFKHSCWYTELLKASRYGLSPFQIPALAWELVPFSFVADWFVNVGDWLYAMTPTPHLEVLNSCVSTVSTRVRTIRCNSANDIWVGWPCTPTDSFCIQTSKQLVRTLNVPLPVHPGFNRKLLNLKRVIDSVSLIWGRLPKYLKR